MDNFEFDLRLLAPALLNFMLYLVNQQLPFVPNFNLNSKIGFFSIVILMFFLITSVALRLTVTPERIRVRIADRFSFFLATTLLGSVFLPVAVFWFGYIIILSIFPWHDSLSELLARFLLSIWVVLLGIPLLFITCIVQIRQQNETETNPPPPPEAEDVAGDIEMGGHVILPEPKCLLPLLLRSLEIGALNSTLSVPLCLCTF
ncbi:hypothetical protein RHMOL_Rhmol05G0049900 [Rhododendron molle]|uniref:Uncharacterized protein n=1 Tax=Rhododendron molle TaxID=49168 RepID=A0ACC0NKX7_RHOML|nr:hypothetical protein RHMOL_Rhmol05G0049900 [Rhododendron molle]